MKIFGIGTDILKLKELKIVQKNSFIKDYLIKKKFINVKKLKIQQLFR